MRAVYGLILLLIHQSQISVHREPGAGRVHDGQARCSGRHGRPLPTPGARRLKVWSTAGVGPAVVPLNTGPGSFSGLIWMGSVTVPLDQRGPRLSLHARRGCWRRGLHRRAPENGSPNPARTESFLEVEHPIEARPRAAGRPAWRPRCGGRRRWSRTDRSLCFHRITGVRQAARRRAPRQRW